MGQFKPWQIVVLALALIGAGVMTFYSCSGGSGQPELATSVNLVDVKTGALFLAKYPEKRPVSYPAKNPETGEATLYPVYQKDGAWYLTSRVIGAAKSTPGLKGDLIADSAGKLNLADASAKRADVFGK
jgi:hypothetical protein